MGLMMPAFNPMQWQFGGCTMNLMPVITGAQEILTCIYSGSATRSAAAACSGPVRCSGRCLQKFNSKRISSSQEQRMCLQPNSLLLWPDLITCMVLAVLPYWVSGHAWLKDKNRMAHSSQPWLGSYAKGSCPCMLSNNVANWQLIDVLLLVLWKQQHLYSALAL